MQQLQFVKKYLTIERFPEIKVEYFGLVNSFQLISASIIFSTITFILTGSLAAVYWLNGLILPLICLYKKIQIVNYWETLSILLIIRLSTSYGQIFDVDIMLFKVFLLVSLWHPNIRLGKMIVNKIGQYSRGKLKFT